MFPSARPYQTLNLATHIEPRQSTSRRPKNPPLPPATSPKPAQWPYPAPRMNLPKIVLLIVQIRRNVRAKKGEKAGDGKCFVALVYHFEVDRVRVKEVGEK